MTCSSFLNPRFGRLGLPLSGVRIVLFAACVWSPGLLFAQGAFIHMEEATNITTCANALPICRDTHFSYESAGTAACLWFRFTVPDSQHVHIEVPGRETAMVDPNTVLCTDCPTMGDATVVDEPLAPGIYVFAVEITIELEFDIEVIEGDLGCPDLPCEGCVPSFSLLPGQRYVVNAWVQQEGVPLGTVNYTTPRVRVEAPPGNVLGVFAPSIVRPVIDGWQLVEGVFQMPPSQEALKLSLECSSGDCLFDDVRVFPADGSMKCYVYDPFNLRYVAELDERHYATFYEYDNEGKLVRVKKETERGIMTIQESRANSSHTP